MYKNNNAFTKKSFFSLFFMVILGAGLLLFTSCSNIFETAIPSQEEYDDSDAAGNNGGAHGNTDAADAPLPQIKNITGQIIITGAVPEEALTAENSQNASFTQNARAAVPSYNPDEVEYFAYAQHGSTTVDGIFGSDNLATTFELPLTEGLEWSITCGLKKITNGEVLFSASTDDDIDPGNLADDAVLQFFPTPDTSGGASSTGEIDLSMTVASTITSYKITCSSSNSANWPFSTTDPVSISGTTITIKTDSVTPSVRSGAYEVIIDFYKEGGALAYSTVQTINVCKNLKTKTWIASGGLTPIESDGTFNVTAAKIASYVNTYIYVGTVEGGTPASDTNAGNHTAPFLTLSRALSYIEGIATAAGANTSLEYKIIITGEVDNTPNTTVPSLTSTLDDKAGKIIIKGRGTSPAIKNPNTNGRILTIETSVPVEFYNLTIKDGNASGSDAEGKGGALYINTHSAKVDLTNCTIKDCSANSTGGGLCVSGTGAKATLTNCTIRDCNAGTLGGAVYVADGTSTAPATAFLYSCLIGGQLESCAGATPVANSGSNSAGGGGGICIGSDGKAILNNTKVIGNIAQNYGGGIRCVGGTLNISQGQINYNYSGASGGGLFIMGSATVTINNLCVIGKAITNSDSAATGLSDCGNYSASEGGGGIRIEGGTLTTDSGFKVTKNYSAGTGANGGGISTKTAITLKKVDISCNKTTGNGGGIYVDTGGEFALANGSISYKSQINKNIAVNGGGIYTGDANVTINVSNFTDIDGNEAACGAGIYSVAGAGTDVTGKLIISGGNTAVVRNQASDTGGGVYNTGTVFIYGGPQIGFNGNGSGGNTSATAGGGIYNTGNLYMGYSAWTDEVTNTAESYGGTIQYNVAPLGAGIYSTGTVYFAKGAIQNQNSTSISSGAGVYLAGGSFTMSGNAKVYANKAQEYGGGIYADASTANVTLTISSTTQQERNGGQLNGGFLYIQNSSTTSATVTLKGDVRIPWYNSEIASWNGKNDIYLNNGLITVSESEPLTGTGVITLTPSSFTMGQPLLTGTGIDANRTKFTLSQDSEHPNYVWSISPAGKLCQPVLKTSIYSTIADLSNVIKNDDGEIQVIIDSAISAADLGASNTPNTIAYGIRHNTNSNAKISLYVAPGVTIPLDNTANAALFDSCSKLYYADLEGCTTSSVTDMSQWFMGCTNLRELNLSGWNTSSVNSMTSMFDGCTRLEKIYVSTFVTAMASSSNNMFYGCTSIIGGLGTTFDSGKTNRDYAHLDGGDTNPGYFSSFQIGSKAMGSTLELGDIIFSDGSAEPYSGSLVLTPRQYLSAVAVIYDAENRKGVNLKEVKKAWAVTSAEGYGIVIGTDADDGTANMAEIQALSDWSETKYPAFWYAAHYGESAPVAGSTEGWYLPAKNEMVAVIANITAVNNSVAKITGATSLTKQTYYRYWTSNNNAAGTSISAMRWAIFVDNGSPGSTGDPRFKEYQNYVRCIRVF